MKTSNKLHISLLVSFLSVVPDVRSQTTTNFTVPSGVSLIGMPFHRGSNTVAELFPSVPEGTLLFTYDCGYNVNQFEFGSWSQPRQTVADGQGMMINNPGAPIVMKYLNEESVTNPTPQLRAGLNLITLPSSGVSSLRVAEEDVLYRLGTNGSLTAFYWVFGEWSPSTPVPSLGEAFFYNAQAATNRLASCDPDGVPVYFNNYVPAYNIRTPFVFIANDDINFSFGSGSSFLAQLLAGRDASSLSPVGEPLPFLTGNGAGFLDTSAGALRYLPASTSVIQIRAWAACTGGTFQEAKVTGSSPSLRFDPAGRFGFPVPPIPLSGLQWLPDLLLGARYGVGPDLTLSDTSNGTLEILEIVGLPNNSKYVLPPSAIVHWYKLDANGTRQEVAATTSSQLELSGANPDVAGEYYAVIDYGCARIGGLSAKVTVASPPLPAPALSIAMSSLEIVLSWPTNAVGYVLDVSDSLAPPSWTFVVTTSILTNENYSIKIPVGAGRKYYRLRKP